MLVIFLLTSPVSEETYSSFSEKIANFRLIADLAARIKNGRLSKPRYLLTSVRNKISSAKIKNNSVILILGLILKMTFSSSILLLYQKISRPSGRAVKKPPQELDFSYLINRVSNNKTKLVKRR